MTASAMLLPDWETDGRVREYAARLGIDDEDAVMLALAHCHAVVGWGQSAEEAVEDGCAVLDSWLHHPSNWKRQRDE